MYEKSEIQKQFPINEKKFKVETFLHVFFRWLYAISIYYLIVIARGDNSFWFKMRFVFAALLLVIFFYDCKRIIKYIEAYYFDVTDAEVLGVNWTSTFPSPYKIALRNVKSIKLARHPFGFFLNSYGLRLSLGSGFVNWVRSPKLYGFDYDTAVALKAYIEDKMVQK